MRRTLIVMALLAGMVVLPAAKGQAAPGRAADFNGDGISDLAIGVWDEDVGSLLQAGAVEVLYGYTNGLRARGDQFWTQDSTGIPDDAESGDQFGTSVAAGDFNGDGFSDLAAGANREDVGLISNAGGVNVLYGSATGLTDDNAQFWTEDSPGVPDTAEAEDRFGLAVAAADFDGDGFADLAIGARGETIGTATEAGAVTILYGSKSGLTSTRSQFWAQDSTAVRETPESYDHFGFSLAAANIGKSSQADLAIGAPHESVGSVMRAGAVNVLYGSPTGLTATGNELWTQDSMGVKNGAEAGDGFGFSLAAANLGKSPQADLAVGVPTEDVGAIVDAGAVNVLHGSPTGLTASGNQFWTQDSPAIKDPSETGDNFGFSVAAADFGKSAEADLAVGVIFEDVGSVGDAGAVNVLYGSSAGLRATGNQFWTQDSTNVKDMAESDDFLGFSVGGANFGKSPDADLVIGGPGEAVGTAAGAGAVNVLYGSGAGLTATGNQFWNQDVAGVAGDGAESGDQFGFAVR